MNKKGGQSPPSNRPAVLNTGQDHYTTDAETLQNEPLSGFTHSDAEQKPNTYEHSKHTNVMAKCAPGVHQFSVTDPDLALLIDRWPRLHPAVKEYIMAFIRPADAGEGIEQ